MAGYGQGIMALHRGLGNLFSQGNNKRGALAQLGLHGNLTVMPFNDFFANRQSNPAALIIPRRMQPFERGEYLLPIRFLDANAVITYRNFPLVIAFPGHNLPNFRNGAGK